MKRRRERDLLEGSVDPWIFLEDLAEELEDVGTVDGKGVQVFGADPTLIVSRDRTVSGSSIL